MKRKKLIRQKKSKFFLCDHPPKERERVKKKNDADECIIKSTRGMIPRSILDRPKKGFDFVCPIRSPVTSYSCDRFYTQQLL